MGKRQVKTRREWESKAHCMWESELFRRVRVQKEGPWKRWSQHGREEWPASPDTSRRSRNDCGEAELWSGLEMESIMSLSTWNFSAPCPHPYHARTYPTRATHSGWCARGSGTEVHALASWIPTGAFGWIWWGSIFYHRIASVRGVFPPRGKSPFSGVGVPAGGRVGVWRWLVLGRHQKTHCQL